MKRLMATTALTLLFLACNPGAGESQRAIGEIVNPSIEQLDEEGQPVHWTLERSRRRAEVTGAEVVSCIADAGSHLRPVHRASGTVHLRRDLGGNAGGSQVLLCGR